MSRNFFSDLLNLDSLFYWVKGTFFGGTWERLQNTKHGGSVIDPTKGPPPQRPGQRPGQPLAGAPQRPGQPPARPAGQPAPVAQVPPQRPGVAPMLPNIPGMPPPPQIPGMQQANQVLGGLPPNPITTRSGQEAQLMKARASNFFQDNLSRSFDRIYTTIRAFLERGQ